MLKFLSRGNGEDEGLQIVETAKNGFQMDWSLKEDFTVCNFDLKCPADNYARYNLRGYLAGQRTESLKLEFGDTKLSLRKFFKNNLHNRHRIRKKGYHSYARSCKM